jgi:hypothetical protein
MNYINTGGPAFPCHPEIDNPKFDGMTLRDYFAAKALQGMLANPVEGNDGMISKRLALWSYEIADAMLKVRGGEK